jgi:hypothetical protein
VPIEADSLPFEHIFFVDIKSACHLMIIFGRQFFQLVSTELLWFNFLLRFLSSLCVPELVDVVLHFCFPRMDALHLCYSR